MAHALRSVKSFRRDTYPKRLLTCNGLSAMIDVCMHRYITVTSGDKQSLFWVEMCPCQKMYLSANAPGSQNVTLFGISLAVDIIT